MIQDFKTYIKESVWSDIHKRSNGEQVRKEDDINQLDYTDFFNYIYCLYWPTEWNDGETIIQFPSTVSDNLWKIQIPVEEIIKFSGSGTVIPPITICFNTNTGKVNHIVIASSLTRKYPNIQTILGNNYKLEPQKVGSPHITKIGKLTNQDCVNIIDKILGMVEKPLFKKNS